MVIRVRKKQMCVQNIPKTTHQTSTLLLASFILFFQIKLFFFLFYFVVFFYFNILIILKFFLYIFLFNYDSFFFNFCFISILAS